jgi:hypothetical protein
MAALDSNRASAARNRRIKVLTNVTASFGSVSIIFNSSSALTATQMLSAAARAERGPLSIKHFPENLARFKVGDDSAA